jgi:putative tryptophan/tyrosine transport system substrate-binding protein
MTRPTIGLLLTLTLSLLAASLAADAQPAGRKVPRIGYFWPNDPLSKTSPRLEVFRQGLHDLGWVEGENVAIEYRWGEGRTERFRDLAVELVRLDVSVIATFGDHAAHAAQQATTTIPIVAMTDNLVETGLVASLARPGGNITGVTIIAPELSAKRLELLKEVVPQVSRVTALWDPSTGRPQVQALEVAAQSLAMQLQVLEVRGADEIARAFDAMQRWGAEALNVLASPLLHAQRQTIIEHAATHRLPAIYQWRESAEDGGLMSYGPILLELLRRHGVLVGKILQGAQPRELPVEQPTRFELVINLKTAQALGITMPSTLLFQASEVIR